MDNATAPPVTEPAAPPPYQCPLSGVSSKHSYLIYVDNCAHFIRYMCVVCCVLCVVCVCVVCCVCVCVCVCL